VEFGKALGVLLQHFIDGSGGIFDKSYVWSLHGMGAGAAVLPNWFW